VSPADATSLAIEAQRLAARVREESLSIAMDMLSRIVSVLGAAVASTSDIKSFSFKSGPEWVGSEEDGQKCHVESVALTLGCGCVRCVESVGGTVTTSVGRQCAEHRPALVMVCTLVDDKEIPF
jgi:Na+/H+-translocating membrane pyrophosphatase